MSNFRIMLLSTVAIGVSGTLAMPASAGEVEKSVSFSGHVNRVVGVVDNGDATKVLTSDNGASMTRLRFVGEAKSDSLTTKTYIEVRARGNRSAAANGTGASGSTLSMRHSYLSLSNSMGTLVLGDTNPAGDVNGWFSGDFNGSNWTSTGGAAFVSGLETPTFIVENSGNTTGSEEGALTSVTPITTVSSGRGGIIRYDSPDFNGFNVSLGLKGGADAAEEPSASLGYEADFDGTKVAIGYGYTNKSGNSTTQSDLHSVGAGFEVASGFNVHGAYYAAPNENSGGVDLAIWNLAAGYDMEIIDAGETSIGINYIDGEDVSVVNDDYQSYGININQQLSDYGTEIYGGISKSKYDRAGTNYEDVVSGWVGARIKF